MCMTKAIYCNMMILIRKSVFSRTCLAAYWTFIWKMRCSIRIEIEINSAYYFTLIYKMKKQRSFQRTTVLCRSTYLRRKLVCPSNSFIFFFSFIRAYEGWMAKINCISLRLSSSISQESIICVHIEVYSFILVCLLAFTMNTIIIIH
jgi:hypothetical protein